MDALTAASKLAVLHVLHLSFEGQRLLDQFLDLCSSPFERSLRSGEFARFCNFRHRAGLSKTGDCKPFGDLAIG